MILYTKEEAASLLKVSKRTLERFLRAGDLRSYKVGSSVRISDEQLNVYLQRNLAPVHVQTMSNPGRKKRRKTATDEELLHYVPGMKVV